MTLGSEVFARFSFKRLRRIWSSALRFPTTCCASRSFFRAAAAALPAWDMRLVSRAPVENRLRKNSPSDWKNPPNASSERTA